MVRGEGGAEELPSRGHGGQVMDFYELCQRLSDRVTSWLDTARGIDRFNALSMTDEGIDTASGLTCELDRAVARLVLAEAKRRGEER